VKLPRDALEPTGAELRALLDLAGARLSSFVDTLPTQPMVGTDGGARLARDLAEPLPEKGTSFRNLLRVFFERVVPGALNTSAPGYLGYIPGGGLPVSALADLLAGTTNRFVGLWMAAPGLVQIETNVVRWFVGMVGYDDAGGGVLTSGGSIANLIALVTARRERLPADFLRGTLYCSAHAHHSVRKAALLAGFPPENVREVPLDASFRIDLAALDAAIAADRAAGWTPFCVVASAGTTALGAVDPIPELADRCAAQGLWLHVDAAYGGFFALTERGRNALTGLERAASITLDPHKGLFLPYGTGCLVVRDRAALRRAHHVDAAYLPPPQTDGDRWDFADLSPELSRDARGMRVWLPMKLAGAGAFRAALDEKLDLARDIAEGIRARPWLELVAPPTLSLLAFRVPGDDAATRALLAGVNQRQRVFLTGVPLDGGFVIRACVLSFRTHRAQVEHLLADLDAAWAARAGGDAARS